MIIDKVGDNEINAKLGEGVRREANRHIEKFVYLQIVEVQS